MKQTASVVGLVLLCVVPTIGRAQCLGDFNGDGKVTIDELTTAVDNALSGCQVSGPRFVDNGDGTVTDHQTRLTWEKKDNLDGDPNPADSHDADNVYSWSNDIAYSADTAPDGTVFTVFLAVLNGGSSADGKTTVGCFAGHCDWRLPTVAELNGIRGLTPGTCGFGGCACSDPVIGAQAGAQCCACIDSVFGPTESGLTWSLSTYFYAGDVIGPTNVWAVNFYDGSVGLSAKCVNSPVRAVRSGS
jgi:hypothetical protein